MLSQRQELLLGKVVEEFSATGQPVGSRVLAADHEILWGPSTVRSELATLEDLGLLAHPHTSAGRVPTDAGYRYYVDNVLPNKQVNLKPSPNLELSLVHQEIHEAMRATTETLSHVTNLLAIVSAPPIHTATIRRIEVLLLQPHLLMIVVITSAGGVTKRIFGFDQPIDPGLAEWVGSYLNERLAGFGLGARMLQSRLADPDLSASELSFIDQISSAFTELTEAQESSIYFDGAGQLLSNSTLDVDELNALVNMLEQRVSLLQILSATLAERDIYVRIGHENELPALHSFALVAANYGLPQRNLGTVSLIGPLRMNYGLAISSVRHTALQLSRFVGELYDEA